MLRRQVKNQPPRDEGLTASDCARRPLTPSPCPPVGRGEPRRTSRARPDRSTFQGDPAMRRIVSAVVLLTTGGAAFAQPGLAQQVPADVLARTQEWAQVL